MGYGWVGWGEKVVHMQSSSETSVHLLTPKITAFTASLTSIF